MMSEEKLLPQHQAILDDDLDTFKKMLDENNIRDLINEKDSKGRNAIFYATKSGSLDRFKCILGFGASLDFIDPQTGDSLLHTVVAYGHGQLIKYLLDECHMDINAVDKNGYTVLGVAMLYAKIDLACYFITKGAKKVGPIPNLKILLKYLPIEIQRLKFQAENISQNEEEYKEYQNAIAMLVNFTKEKPVLYN